jgi:hypothetical protein
MKTSLFGLKNYADSIEIVNGKQDCKKNVVHSTKKGSPRAVCPGGAFGKTGGRDYTCLVRN